MGQLPERTEPASALQDAEERLRAIFETAVDGIIVISAGGIVEQMNPAAERIFGYAAAEVIGSNVSMLMPQPYRDEHDSYLSNYLRTRDPKIIGIGREVTGLRKDGQTFPMDLAVSEVRLQDRTLFTGIVRDISERKRTETALREAQKLDSLGVLAGGIAHDFNNLLVGIIGNAGLALDDLPPESPARASVREIETIGKRAADLAHQMLAYSGKGRLTIEPISMNTVVQEMTHLLNASIRKGIVMRYNLSPRLPAIEADPTQIRQVVMNLVINASDAIGDRSGTITISTGMMRADRAYLREAYLPPDLAEGGYVFMEVSDTGSGISPEVRDKIFDPFFTTKFTGRGLGLAVVLGVIRGHHGALKVYSEPGHGTTFRVLFPPQVGEEREAPQQAGAAWHSSGLILVVDDDETVRAVTITAVQRMGFTVLAAENGLQAVEVFRQHQNDIRLVIMDLTMPAMSGEDAFREIRGIRADAPVIMMSGYNEMETSERFLGKGVDGMLQKPYEVTRLRQLVRDVLQRYER